MNEDDDFFENKNFLIDDSTSIEDFRKHLFIITNNINVALNETSTMLKFIKNLYPDDTQQENILSDPNKNPEINTNFLCLNSVLTEKQDNDFSNIENNTSAIKFGSDSLRIGCGWKLESLNKAINIFKRSYEDLSKRIFIEKKYWNTISHFLDNDEILFKCHDSLDNFNSIGLKYKYFDLESSNYDNDSIILKMNKENGDVFFSFSHLESKIPSDRNASKYIRVKVFKTENNKTTIVSTSSFAKQFNKKSFLLNEIDKIRYFAFESDLFTKLYHEASSLKCFGVETDNKKIIIKKYNYVIIIDFIDYDEEKISGSFLEAETNNFKNNNYSNLLLHYFKIILCCIYDHNLRTKEKKIVFNTNQEDDPTERNIIRSFLCDLTYNKDLQALNVFINNLKTKYNNETQFVNCSQSEVEVQTTNNMSMFENLCILPDTQFDLTLQNKMGHVQNKRITHSFDKKFLNSLFYISQSDLNVNVCETNLLCHKFKNFDELTDYFDWITAEFFNCVI